MERVTDEDLIELGEDYSEEIEESENIKFQEEETSTVTSQDIEMFIQALHDNNTEYIIQNISQMFQILKNEQYLEQSKEMFQNLMLTEPKLLHKYLSHNKQIYEKIGEMLENKLINVQLLHFIFYILAQVINFNVQRQNKFVALTVLTKIYQSSLYYLFHEENNKKLQIYILSFFLSFYSYCPQEYQRQRQFRKLLRAVTEENILNLHSIDIIKQLVNNLAVQSQRELFISLIKQLATFTVELINHRRLIGLFSTSSHKKNTYKESKTSKSKKIIGQQVSLEERIAEKIAQAGTLMFLKIFLQLLKQSSLNTQQNIDKSVKAQQNQNAQNNKDFYFPFVEIVQYQIHYLLQYPRCFPYVLYNVQLYCKDLNYAMNDAQINNFIYIPCQQIFLNILYQLVLPLGKKALDINPLQYRGKLMNAQGQVDFRRQLCIPKQFYYTIQCKEALIQLICQTMIMYFTSILRYRPIIFPEATQVFCIQLQDIINILTDHGYMSPMLGFKVTYNSFQLSSVRSFAKQLKALKRALQADALYIKELRLGINNDNEANDNLCALITQSQLQLPQLHQDDSKSLDTQIQIDTKQQPNEDEQLDERELLDEEQFEEELYEGEYEEEESESETENDIIRKLNL